MKGALNSSILSLTFSHSASVSRDTRSMHLFLSTPATPPSRTPPNTYWHQSPAPAQSLVTAVRLASPAPVLVVIFYNSAQDSIGLRLRLRTIPPQQPVGQTCQSIGSHGYCGSSETPWSCRAPCPTPGHCCTLLVGIPPPYQPYPC